MGCDGQTHRAVRRRPRWPTAGPRARRQPRGFPFGTRDRVWHGAMSRYIRGHGSISTGKPDDTRTCLRDLRERGRRLGRRTGGNANSTAGDPRRSTRDGRCSTTWRRPGTCGAHRRGRAVRSGDGTRALDRPRRRPRAHGVLRPTRCAVTWIGRGLLERAFPAEGARHRAIVATIDSRAIARYLKAGVDARLLVVGWEGTPRDAPLASDLEREEDVILVAPPIDELGAIDGRCLDFRRDVDHRWLATQRHGWLHRRGGNAVGYGYHLSRAGWGGLYALAPADRPCCWPTATRRRRAPVMPS